jgi:hypothetical protein
MEPAACFVVHPMDRSSKGLASRRIRDRRIATGDGTRRYGSDAPQSASRGYPPDMSSVHNHDRLGANWQVPSDFLVTGTDRCSPSVRHLRHERYAHPV